jgi:hypothetical protein
VRHQRNPAFIHFDRRCFGWLYPLAAGANAVIIPEHLAPFPRARRSYSC